MNKEHLKLAIELARILCKWDTEKITDSRIDKDGLTIIAENASELFLVVENFYIDIPDEWGKNKHFYKNINGVNLINYTL